MKKSFTTFFCCLLLIPFTAWAQETVSDPTTCAGTPTVITIANSQTNISYQLNQGVNPFLDAQTGTGGSLTFTVSPTVTTTYTVTTTNLTNGTRGELTDKAIVTVTSLPIIVRMSTKKIIDDDFNQAWAVEQVDFDKDGDNDVLVARNRSSFSWYENNGSQAFTKHQIGDTTNFNISFEVTDMDKDGDLDLLSPNRDSSLTWWENDGNQQFTERFIAQENALIIQVTALDIDEDGDMDFFSGHANQQNELIWWENDGNQQFTRHVIENDHNPSVGFSIADMDGDGHLDIVSPVYSIGAIYWWRNDGNQTFTKNTLEDDISRPIGMKTFDMDGDGDMDVVAGSFLGSKLFWWENDGSGQFTIRDLGDFNFPTDVRAGDIAGDGAIDIISTSFAGDDLVWWENDGNQSYSSHDIELDFDGARGAFLGDLDKDGDLDVLAVAAKAGEVAWWEQELVAAPMTVSVENNIIEIGSPVTFSYYGATSYTFYINGVEVQEGSNSSFTTSSLTNGDKVKVMATNDGGCSITSPEITMMTPGVIYVDSSATGENTGASWSAAFTDFQAALDAAQVSDEIWVAKGTYYPSKDAAGTLVNDQTATFVMKNNLGIYGGFAGGETDRTNRDLITNPTILSGDIDKNGVLDAANSYHVFFHNNIGLDNTAILDGFMITGGNANGGSFPDNTGGGMYNFRCHPTINNCIFLENEGTNGAAMSMPSSNPILTNCVFQANSGGLSVMSIYSEAKPTLVNCTFMSNHLISSSSGIISINQANEIPSIINCTFSGNSGAPTLGINNGDCILKNTIIWGNSDNTITGNFTATYSLIEGINPSGTGNLDGTVAANAPQFVLPVDPANAPAITGDLRLTACSPLLNIGDNTDIDGMSEDLAGNPRIYNGGIVDLGAYEYQGATATHSTTIMASATTINSGDLVTFTATNGTNYEFFVNEASVQNSSSATYQTTVLSHNDKVKVVTTNSLGCRATSDEITITVNAVVNAGPDQLNICGMTAQLAAIEPTTGTGQWTATPSGGSFVDATQHNTEFQGLLGTAYTLTWTVAGTSDQVQISFNGDADNDMVPDCNDICPGGDDRVNTDGLGMPDDCDCDPNDSSDEYRTFLTSAHPNGMSGTQNTIRSYQISSEVAINAGANITFTAGHQVLLQPGFHAKAGADFLAKVELCNDPNNSFEETPVSSNARNTISTSPFMDIGTPTLNIYPNPLHDHATIAYQLRAPGEVSIAILNQFGQLIASPIQRQQMEAGNHQLPFQSADLRAGVYYLSLLYQGKRITQKMVLLN